MEVVRIVQRIQMSFDASKDFIESQSCKQTSSLIEKSITAYLSLESSIKTLNLNVYYFFIFLPKKQIII